VYFEVQRTGLFDAWLEDVTDEIARKAILDRVFRVESGLLGHHRSVGGGVSEIKVDVGQGYRLYYTMRGRTAVHLLCGGSKRTQKTDIRKAAAMAKALGRTRTKPSEGRVRERRSPYAPQGDGKDEFRFTDEELELSPFDAADYIRGDDETQIYLLRRALSSGHAAYIANAVGAVARARGLTRLREEPILETLTRVLHALGRRLEVVEKGQVG
jgi:putative addiction module killer protein